VVNNNARRPGARGHRAEGARTPEEIVSGGELIEIGARFRLPDCSFQPGARLRGWDTRTGRRWRTTPRRTDRGPRHPRGTVQLPRQRLHRSRDRRGAWPGWCPVVFDIGYGCSLRTPCCPVSSDAATARGTCPHWSGERRQAPRRPAGGLLLGRSGMCARLRRHPRARALGVEQADTRGAGGTGRTGTAGGQRDAPPTAASSPERADGQWRVWIRRPRRPGAAATCAVAAARCAPAWSWRARSVSVHRIDGRGRCVRGEPAGWAGWKSGGCLDCARFAHRRPTTFGRAVPQPGWKGLP